MTSLKKSQKCINNAPVYLLSLYKDFFLALFKSFFVFFFSNNNKIIIKLLTVQLGCTWGRRLCFGTLYGVLLKLFITCEVELCTEFKDNKTMFPDSLIRSVRTNSMDVFVKTNDHNLVGRSTQLCVLFGLGITRKPSFATMVIGTLYCQQVLAYWHAGYRHAICIDIIPLLSHFRQGPTLKKSSYRQHKVDRGA